jgi:hypothetical protein
VEQAVVHVERVERARPDAALVASGAVFLVCLATWELGWRGSDVPAQMFRVDLFRESGLTVWNAAWYGGHHTPAYSILFPAVASVLGTALTGALATAAAIAIFRVLTVRIGRASALGLGCFAAVMVANYMVGRLPFALGVAIGLVALDLLVRRHPLLAAAAAALTALASPVSAAFLALAVAGWGLAGVRTPGAGTGWRRLVDVPATDWHRLTMALTVGLAAVVPVSVLNAVFPEGGRFPFRTGALLLALGASVAAVVLLPRSAGTLRIAAVLFVVVAPAVYLIPNPMGGNLTRLALLAAPAMIVAADSRPVRALVLAGPLLVWQLAPAVDAVAQADDPSADPAYHEPLVAAVEARAGDLVRIEIPFTRNHWETVFVAEHLQLARGWERQVDIERNPLFYEDGLTADAYLAWLWDNGISFVAVPDVALDPSAEAEAALIDAGVPGLDLVWRNQDWRLYEVHGSPGLFDGPGDLLSIEADEVTFVAREPGLFRLRLHPSTHMTLADGAGCVRVGADGWTELEVLRAGYARLVTTVSDEPDVDCGAA